MRNCRCSFLAMRFNACAWYSTCCRRLPGPGSGLDNLLFDSTYAPVAYSLLMDHKGTDRSPARKTKSSRPDPILPPSSLPR